MVSNLDVDSQLCNGLTPSCHVKSTAVYNSEPNLKIHNILSAIPNPQINSGVLLVAAQFLSAIGSC